MIGMTSRSSMNWPWPSTRETGRKTITVVRVAVVIASAISPAPWSAAWRRATPLWCSRWMFSATTTELSTRRPTEIIRPE